MTRFRFFFVSLNAGLTKLLSSSRGGMLVLMAVATISFSMWLINDTLRPFALANSSCTCGCQASCTGSSLGATFDKEAADTVNSYGRGWPHIEMGHIEGVPKGPRRPSKGSLFPAGTDKSDLSGLLSSMDCYHFKDHQDSGNAFERKVIIRGVCGNVRLIVWDYPMHSGDMIVKTMYPTEKMNPNCSNFSHVTTNYGCNCVCNQTQGGGGGGGGGRTGGGGGGGVCGLLGIEAALAGLVALMIRRWRLRKYAAVK